MQLSINSPITPTAPTVAGILVLEAHVLSSGSQNYLIWSELDGYSNVIQNKSLVLTPTQTTSFFATSVTGYITLQDVFDAAIASVLTSIYGPVTITSP